MIFTFHSIYASGSVGKRKWNKYSIHIPVGEFVTCADEAFVMIALENNILKWTNELKDSTLSVKERWKSLYTEGESGVKNGLKKG